MSRFVFIVIGLCYLANDVLAGFGCRDWASKCGEYQKKGWCQQSHQNNRYMKNMCPKICGFCGISTPVPAKTTQAPVKTTQAPVKTTQTPVKTTHIPVRTTQAPAATTYSPSESTEMPRTSNPSTGNCASPEIVTSRVVAGSTAKLGQFPWQVAIYVNGLFFCGGSILTPEWVLTAAHCLWDLQPTHNVTVVAGDFERSTLTGEEQVSELEMPHIHPHYYQPIEFNNDIALMKLKTPFKLGKFVRTVCIPQEEEEVAPGSRCFISGWGKTHKDGESEDKLRYASLNIVNQTECARKNYRISDRMICGYDQNNEKAAGCNGDSGGPLVCQGVDGNWKLHGIVSWGSSSCDTRYKYTVFVKMSKFRYFINETLGLIKKPTLAPPPKGDCDADVSSAAAFRFAFSGSEDDRTCGLTSIAAGRVISGQTSKAGQFPWQVAIYKTNRINQKDTYETKFQCGGSLISPNWVLTAAHCVYRSYARKFNISIGNTNRNVSSMEEQIVAVERLITFPKYKRPVSLNNDVALLKLVKPIRLGAFRNTICLPKQGEKIAVGSKCFVSGWGKTENEPFVVDKLQHASLRIISNKECYRRQWRINEITDQMVCAGNGKGCPQSGCQGDSGGPLTCQRADGSWVQHGIVSWGSPYCDTAEAYTAFARVSEFRDWIDEMQEKYK